MTITQFLDGIVNAIVEYHNYQVGRNTELAASSNISLSYQSREERKELKSNEHAISELIQLCQNISKLYTKRDSHLNYLSTLFNTLQTHLEHPQKDSEAQANTLVQEIGNYLSAIVALFKTAEPIILPNKIKLKTLLAYSMYVNTGTSALGTILEAKILAPLDLNPNSSPDDILSACQDMKADLISLLTTKLALDSHINSPSLEETQAADIVSLQSDILLLKQQLQQSDEAHSATKEKLSASEQQLSELIKQNIQDKNSKGSPVLMSLLFQPAKSSGKPPNSPEETVKPPIL